MLAEMFQLFGTIGIKTEGAYKDLQQFEDRVQKTANGMHDKFQKAGESISHVGNKMKDVGTNMTTGVSLPLAGIGAAAVKVASDFDTSQRNIQSSLGLTEKGAENLGKIAKETWKDGFGQSIEEVDQSLIKVYQNMKDVPHEELEEATKSAMTLGKTFDSDINEVTRGAGQLMTNFGISSKEAFDLFAAGGQEGLNYSNEMFDNVAEYAPLYKQAGFSANEMFTIMANGTRDGSYNLDYINDLVKEFGIRVQDGSKGVSDAFAEMSPQTQKVWDNFNKGKGTSADVIQSAWNFIKFTIINAVREFVGFVITNFNKLYNTITDVVGGIKEFIVSNFKTIKKAITGAFTGVVDTVKDVFSKVGSIVKNVAKDAVSWGKDIIAGIGEGMSGMADWLIKKAKGVVSGIPKAVLKFFGIRSPSRLMMEYGGYITEGLGVGMEKMIPAVDKASELLNKAVVPPKPMKLVTDVSNQIGQMGARSADLIGKTAHPFAGQTHVEKKTDNGVSIQNATFKVSVEKLQSADDFVKMRKLLQNVVADDLMGMAVRNV
ncbi:phage tail tape measure protein [Bacillus cereus]|uniref:phage tail tape measure protein n=1 Tax=Bacillus cereus TaxID=1396 RepID=UPI001FFCA53F|nr:phage tail tape measure protein [Bacillus cereus]UPJ18632.1 phage tail tape measure protein [Bacillus cereus]